MSDFRRAGRTSRGDRENMLDIDHHLANSRFGKLNYILETGVLDGDLRPCMLRELGITIAADIATCILTTIMTDTGGFMHTNTTSEMLELSAEFNRGRQGTHHRTDLRKRVAATKLVWRSSSARLAHDGRYC